MECQKVISYFNTISSIPRMSGDEQAISDYIMAFAEERGLEALRDDMNNVIVKKPASDPSCTETVILQGHLDMVYVKTEDSAHQYEDGIQIKEDDMFYFAGDTTLGADNGIAVAYCLAVLDSKELVHPNLEVIFTAQEEVGLAGADALDISDLKGDKFINLDSEEEGIFYSSCAGGLRCRMYWNKEIKRREGTYHMWKVSLHELKGGHSGMNISAGRGNAIVLLGRMLYALRGLDVKVGQIDFPGKANAIPSTGSFCIYAEPEKSEAVAAKLGELEAVFKKELQYTDSIMVRIEEEQTENPNTYTDEFQKKLISSLNLLPNGVYTYSQSMEGLVESSMNLGALSEEDEGMMLLVMIRSSVASRKYELKNKIQILADTFCDACSFENDYPGWEFRRESMLRDMSLNIYEELFGKKAEAAAIHAGLECGYWDDKKPGMDIISMGPDMYDVHSPKERVSKQSIVNMWRFLTVLLERLAKSPQLPVK